MQFTETKKQTALAKRTAFRRKAYCRLSSEVVGVNLSYSYANGFGAGVSIGTDNKTQLGGSIGLNYNAKSGSWGATAGLKVGLGGTDSQGNYSNWVDAGIHVNNIGRESQSQGVSANIRGQYNEKKGLNGSLGLSYDTKAGYGATIGLTSSLGPVNVTPSWTVSEYGGLSSDVQYGFDKNLFNRTNNPDHSAANRNLLSDIFDGLSGLVSGVGRGVKSAWDGMAGAVGNALDSVGNFLSKTYDKLFGPKIYPMMVIGGGMSPRNADLPEDDGSNKYQNIDTSQYDYLIVNEDGKTESLESYKARVEGQIKAKLEELKSEGYAGDPNKDAVKLVGEYIAKYTRNGHPDKDTNNLFGGWDETNEEGIKTTYLPPNIDYDSISVNNNGAAYISNSLLGGFDARVKLVRSVLQPYFVQENSNGQFYLYHRKLSGDSGQYSYKLLQTVPASVLYPQDGPAISPFGYKERPEWAKPYVDLKGSPYIPGTKPIDTRPFPTTGGY
ncbi:hypothetical protein LEP1GSC133_0768 [Leptospira borgpetersenii serovar Pomona str. 200901868]|uniref:Uncharacterized protein n=1 Tax=Leptospira borgpetersenii serovar Pomona str. 200901868 TaxID=1192866 RepID=M6WTK0_LEPBO|nr:hypothetical protein LEP1GSC133_0768 [Leptospira borgpetersenii serovar Pomona str. 200901868]